MNQAKEYLHNRIDELLSITGTVQSRVRRLQHEEIDARKKIIQTKTRKTGTSTN